jgi:branched-chain amino acid transport system ATP-binding protein
MIKALKGISFEVEKGEIVALIGSNGAGKTTTLHAISGLIFGGGRPYCLQGTPIMTKMPGYKIVGMGIAQVPEGRRVFSGMSVLNNLKLGAYTRKRQE